LWAYVLTHHHHHLLSGVWEAKGLRTPQNPLQQIKLLNVSKTVPLMNKVGLAAKPT
jgi:hypothetical protein